MRLVNADADCAVSIDGSLRQSVCLIWSSECESLGPAYSGVIKSLKRNCAEQVAEGDTAVQNVEVPAERCGTRRTGWDA